MIRAMPKTATAKVEEPKNAKVKVEEPRKAALHLPATLCRLPCAQQRRQPGWTEKQLYCLANCASI